MPDLFNIAKGALNTYQTAVFTTGNNITNANVQGYTRQEVMLGSRQGQGSGTVYIGAGVQITDMRRLVNEFANTNVRESLSQFNEFDTYTTFAQGVDRMLADPNIALGRGLEDFFGSLQSANDNPSLTAGRQVLLSHSTQLVQRFQGLHAQLDQELDATNQQVETMVAQVNRLTSSLASINNQISGTSVNAFDLMDQRDQILSELSKFFSIKTVEQEGSGVNTFLKNGQPLVVGGVATQFTTVNHLIDPTQKELAIQTPSGGIVRLNPSDLEGGQIGGILRFRQEVLFPSIQKIDHIALGLAFNMNTQNRLGMDLNGQLGANYFGDINSSSLMGQRMVPSSSNQGNAFFSVEVTDPNQISSDNFQITYRGGSSFLMTNLRTQQSSTLNIPTFPYQGPGYTLHLDSGSLSTGDTFLLNPTRGMAEQITMNVNRTDQLALASPIRAKSSDQNAGSGQIAFSQITDPTTTAFTTQPGALSPPLRIEFLSENRYRVLNATNNSVLQAGPISFIPGQSQALLPLSAMHSSTASGLVVPGSLGVLNAGDLILNGTAVGAAVADGVSTSDSSGSAIATAAAINLGTGTHGVTALAQENRVNLGSYTSGGTLAAGQFQINGQNIVVGGTDVDSLLTAINTLSGTTGVRAETNGVGHVQLYATDGRNIQLTTTGTSPTATFTNFSLTGGALDRVQRGQVTLSRADGNIVIAGAAPGDVGLTAGTYSPYDPGYRVNLSGSPEAGDTFTIEYNQGGIGDNSNGLKMHLFQTQKNLDQGTTSLTDVHARMLSDVGTYTHTGSLSQKAAQSYMQQADAERQRISGVNLDEETATLLQYEQAYRASAQMIQIGQQMIDTLFSIMR